MNMMRAIGLGVGRLRAITVVLLFLTTLAVANNVTAGKHRYIVAAPSHHFTPVTNNYIACGTHDGGTGTFNCTLPSGTTSGNSVVGFCVVSGSGTPTFAMSGGTYTAISASGSTGIGGATAGIVSTPTAGTTTITISEGVDYATTACVFFEVAGVVTSSPDDASVAIGTTGWVGSSATVFNTGSVTTTNANDEICGFAFQQSNMTFTAGSGYSMAVQGAYLYSGGYQSASIECGTSVLSSTGSYNPSMTQSINGTGVYVGTIAFKLQ